MPLRHKFTEDENLEWWPLHVQVIVAAIGAATGEQRLRPEHLRLLPSGFGRILPGHEVTFRHVSGKELGTRKGHYLVLVDGPVYAGSWRFQSGKLEKLARAAAKKSVPKLKWAAEP
ncbi:MAG TPA: hypothetical protein VH684_04300 [Xanthobacteraceae bacterium]|jgi:hypothetical protein